jgi:hypothetical protein
VGPSAAAALIRHTHGWFAVLCSEQLSRSIILAMYNAGALTTFFARTDKMRRYLHIVGGLK